MVTLWHAYRGGGFGNGPLPFPGGFAQQPACVIESFKVMDRAAADLKADRGDE
jgi:hypothetical protein